MSGTTARENPQGAGWRDAVVCRYCPIYLLHRKRTGYVTKMREVLSYVNRGQISVVTSAVTLPEILMKPLQNNDTQLVNQYRMMFYHTQGVTITSISPRVGDIAANLRAQHNIRTPDALHLACGIDAGCDAFLTNDKGLRRVGSIRVLVLDELDL